MNLASILKEKSDHTGYRNQLFKISDIWTLKSQLTMLYSNSKELLSAFFKEVYFKFSWIPKSPLHHPLINVLPHMAWKKYNFKGTVKEKWEEIKTETWKPWELNDTFKHLSDVPVSLSNLYENSYVWNFV